MVGRTGRQDLAAADAGFLRLCGCMIAALGSFYLLFSAQPVHAAALAGEAGAGAATAVLVAATILGEAAAPLVIGRFGRPATMIVSILVLAATSAMAFAASIGIIYTALALRGLGLGLLLVAGCGLAVKLAPPLRQTETMAFYGFAAAIPAVVFVPMGPWLLDFAGPTVTAGSAVVLSIAALLGVTAEPTPAAETSLAAANGRQLAIWPISLLVSGAIAAGVLITFVTLTHRHLPVEALALGLFLHGVFAAISRWVSGGLISRHGARVTTVVGVFALLAGCACLSAPTASAVWAGSALAGAAFGILQNVSLAEMLRGAPASATDQVSAVWNIAYDVGLGVGGLGFIFLAPLGSVAAYLWLTVALASLLLVAGLVSHRRTLSPSQPTSPANLDGTTATRKQES